MAKNDYNATDDRLPCISIITVSLNAEAHIEDTINSVRRQTYQNKEYIVVDGGSTDNTVEIIKRHDAHIDYWVSEPDGGIAEAMNKGIRQAVGDYLLFLNADDYLIDDGVLEEISKLISNDVDINLFKVSFLYKGGIQKTSYNRSFCWMTNFKMGSCHQGQFISRTLLLKLGMYDTSLGIGFDYDFFLRAYRSSAQSKSFDKTVSVMRKEGISSQNDRISMKRRFNEEQIAHIKNCDGKFMYYVYKLYWALYMPYRYFKSLAGLV